MKWYFTTRWPWWLAQFCQCWIFTIGFSPLPKPYPSTFQLLPIEFKMYFCSLYLTHKSNEKFFVYVSRRMSPKNMLTCGLWCAPGKPNMQVYLKKLVDEINNIYEHGYDFYIQGNALISSQLKRHGNTSLGRLNCSRKYHAQFFKHLNRMVFF